MIQLVGYLATFYFYQTRLSLQYVLRCESVIELYLILLDDALLNVQEFSFLFISVREKIMMYFWF